MDLSIIVLNYKTMRLLRECLRSIRFANPQLRFEVIVVDNASGDGTAAMVRQEFPEHVLIESSANRGYAGGNNLGLAAAKGRHVMIMNADIFVKDGVLEELVRYLDAHPEVGMVGPRLVNGDGSAQESHYRFHTLDIPMLRRTPLGATGWGSRKLDAFLMKDVQPSGPTEVDWLLGGAVVARREAVAEVGLLDERFFLYFDDVDWCRRFWEKGWKVVYLPDVSLIHLHQRQSAEGELLAVVTNPVTRIHIRSAVQYFRKYWRKPNPRTGEPIRL